MINCNTFKFNLKIFLYIPSKNSLFPNENQTKLKFLFVQLIGYICAIEALVLSAIALCHTRKYRQVPDDESDLFLEEGRELSPMSPISSTGVPNHNQISPVGDVPNHHQYKLSTASNQKPYIPGKYLFMTSYINLHFSDSQYSHCYAQLIPT